MFYESDPTDLKAAIDRALILWDSPAQWQQVQKNAMAKNIGWYQSIEMYLELYSRLLNAG